jgi:hypothetical protein
MIDPYHDPALSLEQREELLFEHLCKRLEESFKRNFGWFRWMRNKRAVVARARVFSKALAAQVEIEMEMMRIIYGVDNGTDLDRVERTRLSVLPGGRCGNVRR